MADKYQTHELYSLCMKAVSGEALRPEIACEVFASADRFMSMADLRRKALEMILIHPGAALKTRPKLRPELLKEILHSRLLCIPSDALSKILREWGEQDGDLLQPIVEAQLAEKKKTTHCQALH